MMKKIFNKMFVLFSIFGYSITFGAFGFRGGLSLANMEFDPSPPSQIDKKYKNGFNVCLFEDYSLDNSYSNTIFGIGYETKGVKLSDNSYSETISFNYVTFPIIFKMGNIINDKNIYRHAIGFGVEPAFKVSSKVSSGGQSGNVSGVSTFDLGISCEISEEILISQKGGYLVLGSNFTYGVLNTVEQGSGSAQNYGFEFFFGFKFDINKQLNE